ncbi:hypothetical protein BJ944DRAFT_231881 [Cunninghamella echinulata]|nr:hypothetical protein BJ944DRAFT_231881 [Cunninghamella echinulata]
MSLSFWITFGLISVWLTYTYFKLRVKNSIYNNRNQLLQQLDYDHPEYPTFLGFFHPYCDAGGGGERVLWTAIRDVQREFSDILCVIYTGDTGVTKEQIIHKVKMRFNIELDAKRLAFIFLEKRYLVEGSRYPRFTLILQSLGSIILGYEALTKLVPDVFFGK